MTPEPPRRAPVATPIPAHVWAIVRGGELAGDGSLRLSEAGVEITAGRGRVLVPTPDIDGVRRGETELTLFVRNGDVIELSGDARLAAAARELERSALALPEQTLPLRGFGSRRANPGVDHDRFFAPLLRARREAEEATGPAPRLDAFDAGALSADVDQVMYEFAAERFPDAAPHRRALLAELLDAAAPLRASLEALAAAADAVRDAADDLRFARWREWSAAVHGVFEAADRCWLAAQPALGEPVVTKRGFWRRLLRLGGAGRRRGLRRR